ncbi:MAG: RNA repair transcriptional activator RtcR [Pseudomonadota bacterium]
MQTTVISLLGTQLDIGRKADRWNRWRPNVGLCQQEDLLVDRLELLHGVRYTALAEQLRDDIAAVSPETEVRLQVLEFQDPWDFEEVYGKLLDFTRQYPFDTDAERYLAHLTTGTHVAQICWFLLTEARYLPGKLIQTSPPPRRDGEVSGAYHIIDLDLSRYDQIASRFAEERQEGTSFLKSGIVTRNAAFNAMIEQIEQVVIRSTAPVLLLGPTGAGKSQLARRIYELKHQRHLIAGPFVEVNCATLRGDNAMSALFGHRKGAFTGAVAERAGLLRAADGGLLFLDEIGELGLDEQAMILRAVEDRRFFPVGADREVSSDFQLIAGTNRDLRKAAREGSFREDLLARLDLWTFELPGLRERREDIEANVEYELRRVSSLTGTKAAFNKEALARYLRFATSEQAHWVGNFRDLGASITRMATLAGDRRINEDLVAQELDRLRRAWRGVEPEGPQVDQALLEDLLSPQTVRELDLFDRLQLSGVIDVCRRSETLSAAGRTLFGASRQARRTTNDADRLRKYLQRFGLSWREIKALAASRGPGRRSRLARHRP